MTTAQKIAKRVWAIICAVGVVLGILGYFDIQPFLTKPINTPSKVSKIDSDDNNQAFDSPRATIIETRTSPEEIQRQEATFENTEKIIRLLEEKGYDANPQLISKLNDKIQELEKSLDKLAVHLSGFSLSDSAEKDKRTEDERRLKDLMGKADADSLAAEYDKLIAFRTVCTVAKGFVTYSCF